MSLFVYPKELRKGDRVVIKDDDRIFSEEIESITVDEADPDNKKVLVFTVHRTLVCDPGLKVQISVRRGPEGE